MATAAPLLSKPLLTNRSALIHPYWRFFIAFARVFGTKYGPETIRLQLNTNNHPVSKFRAIGTLQNMPEFREAFHCKLNDSMTRAPEQQCKLW